MPAYRPAGQLPLSHGQEVGLTHSLDGSARGGSANEIFAASCPGSLPRAAQICQAMFWHTARGPEWEGRRGGGGTTRAAEGTGVCSERGVEEDRREERAQE